MAHFERWAKNPAVCEWICQDWITPEERQARLREIYGLPPEPAAEVAPTTRESNPVKPNPTPSNPNESNPLDQDLRLAAPAATAGKISLSPRCLLISPRNDPLA